MVKLIIVDLKAFFKQKYSHFQEKANTNVGETQNIILSLFNFTKFNKTKIKITGIQVTFFPQHFFLKKKF